MIDLIVSHVLAIKRSLCALTRQLVLGLRVGLMIGMAIEPTKNLHDIWEWI